MWSILLEVYVVISVSVILLYISYLFGEVNNVSVNKSLEVRMVYQVINVLLFGMLLSVGTFGMDGVGVFNEVIEWNGIVKFGNIMLYLFGSLCLLGVIGSSNGSILVLLCILGLSLLISSRDLLSVYLCVELQSLGFYVLVTLGSSRGMLSSYSTEGGLKYFIVGGFGSGLLLCGMSIIYSATGTIGLEELSWLLSDNDVSMNIGIVLLLSGLLFKMSAVPFHQWLVDVIEGGSNRTSRLLSILPKLGVLCILIKLVVVLGTDVCKDFLMLSGVLSVIVSVIGAFYQRKVKRFIAYSSIGHVGYMMLGVSVGIESVLNYMLVYVLLSWCLWIIIEDKKLVWIEEVGIAGKENKVLGVSIVILLLSMAGVPPFIGFYVKVDIFKDVLLNGYWMAGLIGLLCTVVGTFNYLRWMKVIYN